ncbi:cytochrome c [uncultured Tateyamaria sp.]|uniref:c-type cytochrome n=1 Tax=uncultured Tateyamaria sp. TaxID=455651 RepID=UPI002631ABCC|nr:cytochrome c [uncultured Tateyamaria sp.]
MRLGVFAVCVVAATSGIALAHSGVKNAAVMQRMIGMSDISENMKIIGDMAKRQTPFDGEAARAAAVAIAGYAAQTPELFAAFEMDPKSEAKPDIWDNFDDFRAKSMHMQNVAMDLSTSMRQPEDLVPALAALGETCRACHKAYRD